MGAIHQEHVSKGALVLVMAVGLNGHILPESESRGGVLGVVAVGLALFGCVDAVQSNLDVAMIMKTSMVSLSRIRTTGPSSSAAPTVVAQAARRAPQRRLLMAPLVSTCSQRARTGSLHFLGILINHQVSIGRPLKHDVDP